MRAWEVETGKMLSEAEGHGGRQVTSMWVVGERMVTGGVDGTVMVWNVGGGVVEEVRRFNALEKARAGAGQRHGVTSVCGHGSRVYSGVAGEGQGAGNDVLVWVLKCSNAGEFNFRHCSCTAFGRCSNAHSLVRVRVQG